MSALLFIEFSDAESAENAGCTMNFAYPVYHIDVLNDGGDVAFLISNQEGKFVWAMKDKVRRSSPPKNKGNNNGNGRREPGRRDPGRKGKKRRDEDDDNRGNRKNPYEHENFGRRAHRNSILG